MPTDGIPAWRTHDWKVRTIESVVAGGGSRLAFTCRSCGRAFVQTTLNRRTWAVDKGGVALSDEVTDRWLEGICLRRPGETDDDDRLMVKNAAAAQ